MLNGISISWALLLPVRSFNTELYILVSHWLLQQKIFVSITLHPVCIHRGSPGISQFYGLNLWGCLKCCCAAVWMKIKHTCASVFPPTVGAAGSPSLKDCNTDSFHLVWVSVHSLVTGLASRVPWWSECVQRAFPLWREHNLWGKHWIVEGFYGTVMV